MEQLRQEVAQAHYMETQTQHLLHQARANQTQVRPYTSVSCSAWFASGCHVVSDSSPPLPPRSQLCEAIQLETRRVLELECLRLTDLRELHGLETAARFIAYR